MKVDPRLAFRFVNNVLGLKYISIFPDAIEKIDVGNFNYGVAVFEMVRKYL